MSDSFFKEITKSLTTPPSKKSLELCAWACVAIAIFGLLGALTSPEEERGMMIIHFCCAPSIFFLGKMKKIDDYQNCVIASLFFGIVTLFYFLVSRRKRLVMSKAEIDAEIASIEKEEKEQLLLEEKKEEARVSQRTNEIETLSRGHRPAESVDVTGFVVSSSDFGLLRLVGLHTLTAKTKRKYEGKSSGFSFRVVKNVSYRTGKFSGISESFKTIEDLGECELLITNSYIFIRNEAGVKRYPRVSVIGYRYYSDGLSLDLSSGNPLVFYADKYTADSIVAASLFEEHS